MRCDDCASYEPEGARVLIIKLAAAGDVLRTTAVLDGLRRRHAPCSITWVTAAAAAPLLRGHPDVDRVVPFTGALPVELAAARPFDHLLCLDAARDACALASMIPAGERTGFGLAPDGKLAPLSPGAEEWFELGLDDERKRANRRTYFEHLSDVAGVPVRSKPRLCLDDRDRAEASELLARHGVGRAARRIGLNTGAGFRWPLKKWTFEGQVELTRRLGDDPSAPVLLLGGPEETERNAALAAAVGSKAIRLPCDLPVRVFAAVIERLDVLVTGDTLAMQIATALGVRQVVLFGPTSAAEIDLFGRGEKITSDEVDCLSCYRTSCDKDPNCMNTISAERVEHAVRRQLETFAERPA